VIQQFSFPKLSHGLDQGARRGCLIAAEKFLEMAFALTTQISFTLCAHWGGDVSRL
jgi:hypothetical protein